MSSFRLSRTRASSTARSKQRRKKQVSLASQPTFLHLVRGGSPHPRMDAGTIDRAGQRTAEATLLQSSEEDGILAPVDGSTLLAQPTEEVQRPSPPGAGGDAATDCIVCAPDESFSSQEDTRVGSPMETIPASYADLKRVEGLSADLPRDMAGSDKLLPQSQNRANESSTAVPSEHSVLGSGTPAGPSEAKQAQPGPDGAEDSFDGTTILPSCDDTPLRYAVIKGQGNVEQAESRLVPPGQASSPSSLTPAANTPQEPNVEQGNDTPVLDLANGGLYITTVSMPSSESHQGGIVAENPASESDGAARLVQGPSPRLATQEQSPWAAAEDELRFRLPPAAFDGNSAQEKLQTQETEPRDSAFHQQSPWSMEGAIGPTLPISMSTPGSLGDDTLRETIESDSPTSENPWTHTGPLPAWAGRPGQTGPSVTTGGGVASGPARPTTPQGRPSSLPTPDSTCSIKSFRVLLSPFVKPPRKRRRAQPLSPSCHVRFAPLPGEEGYDESLGRSGTTNGRSCNEDRTEAGLPRKRSRLAKAAPASSVLRTASPPPNNVPNTSLPGEVEKFKSHYDAIAKRRIPTTPYLRQRLLPSASQQVLETPAVGAMAERFIEADKQAADLAQQNPSGERSTVYGPEGAEEEGKTLSRPC